MSMKETRQQNCFICHATGDVMNVMWQNERERAFITWYSPDLGRKDVTNQWKRGRASFCVCVRYLILLIRSLALLLFGGRHGLNPLFRCRWEMPKIPELAILTPFPGLQNRELVRGGARPAFLAFHRRTVKGKRDRSLRTMVFWFWCLSNLNWRMRIRRAWAARALMLRSKGGRIRVDDARSRQTDRQAAPWTAQELKDIAILQLH